MTLAETIAEIDADILGRYASPRMTAELNARGHACSENTVATPAGPEVRRHVAGQAVARLLLAAAVDQCGQGGLPPGEVHTSQLASPPSGEPAG
jgi:hypothetical protein